jgi:hypothetical protein
MSFETLIIFHIVTDDDGSLKIKEIDEFRDSNAYSEMEQAIQAMIANQQ